MQMDLLIENQCNRMFSLICLFVALVVSHFGLEGRTLVLIAPIPGHLYILSLVMRKPAFCICENKDADQLRGKREADQRLCFRYKDSKIHLLPKSEIASLRPSSVAVQPGLCRNWSETPKTGFLTTRLTLCSCNSQACVVTMMEIQTMNS